MMSSSGMKVSLEISTKRGSTSLGTFTRAYTSWSSVGVVKVHEQAQRQVRDVRERPARADRQRRQHREDVLAEVALDLARRGAATPRRRRSGCPARASAGLTTSVNCAGVARGRARGPCSAISSQHLGRGQAVGAARVDPRLDLVVHAGDADHEELVEVRGEDREELQPLDQRQRLVLGQLEHAVVEVEPGQLAVDVERGVGELGRAPGRVVGVRRLGVSAPRRRLELMCRSCHRSVGAAIALSSAGRSSTTSSPLATAARPPLRIRACAPVRSCSVSENDGSWPTSSTSPSRRSARRRRTARRRAPARSSTATPSGSHASCAVCTRAQLGAGQAGVDGGRPRRASASPASSACHARARSAGARRRAGHRLLRRVAAARASRKLYAHPGLAAEVSRLVDGTPRATPPAALVVVQTVDRVGADRVVAGRERHGARGAGVHCDVPLSPELDRPAARPRMAHGGRLRSRNRQRPWAADR